MTTAWQVELREIGSGKQSFAHAFDTCEAAIVCGDQRADLRVGQNICCAS